MKEGWEMKKWQDVIDIRSGRNQTEVEDVNGIYPILGSAGKIMGYANKYLCEAGTTIIGRKGTIDNPLYIETRFWNVDTAFGLHALNTLDKRFLFYFCLSYDFKKLDKGSGRPSLVKSDLLLIEIPLPLLHEQQRIVSILDEAFVAIDKAKANAEQNIKNAKELFESYLQDVFENTDWEEKSLGQVCEYDKTSNKRNDLLYVGLEDIQSNTGAFIGLTTPKSVKSSTFYFNQEHVLYGRLRPYLNKVLLPNFEGHCSTEIFPIKPKKDLLDRGFLFQWLISTVTMKKINSTWTGATLPRANMNMVLDFKINLPTLKEQQIIVQKLNALSTETKRLETIYQKKIETLEELKKSILQKAFNGELTEKEILL